MIATMRMQVTPISTRTEVNVRRLPEVAEVQARGLQASAGSASTEDSSGHDTSANIKQYFSASDYEPVLAFVKEVHINCHKAIVSEVESKITATSSDDCNADTTTLKIAGKRALDENSDCVDSIVDILL